MCKSADGTQMAPIQDGFFRYGNDSIRTATTMTAVATEKLS